MIQLGPDELITARPFTDPMLAEPDRHILVQMIRDLYGSRNEEPALARPEKGRDRLIVTATGRVHGDAPVSVVGFFGERRRAASDLIGEQIERVNSEMLSRFEDFPMLLGYVSRLRNDDFNYANLVVVAGDEAIALWRDRAEHIPAAVDLSPQYYSSVRIYNGVMPCGMGCWQHLQLRTVKYWDYDETPVWHAIRSLRFAADTSLGH